MGTTSEHDPSTMCHDMVATSLQRSRCQRGVNRVSSSCQHDVLALSMPCHSRQMTSASHMSPITRSTCRGRGRRCMHDAQPHAIVARGGVAHSPTMLSSSAGCWAPGSRQAGGQTEGEVVSQWWAKDVFDACKAFETWNRWAMKRRRELWTLNSRTCPAQQIDIRAPHQLRVYLLLLQLVEPQIGRVAVGMRRTRTIPGRQARQGQRRCLLDW